MIVKSKQHVEVSVELEEITPQIARQLLADNVENQRSRRDAQVERYARDMLQHNWHDNGETIKVDVNGKLIDGQHRMAAVIEAGVAVKMRVARNVPTEALHSIDIGVARRYADLLRLSGEGHSNIKAVFLRRLYLWERGIRTSKGTIAPSPAELDQMLATNRQLIQMAVARGMDTQKYFRPLSAAVAAMSYYLFASISINEADSFFDRLIDGENMDKMHPIMRLRDRLLQPTRRYTTDEKLAIVIRAWNHYRAGTSAESIVVSPKGALNDNNFPEPK